MSESFRSFAYRGIVAKRALVELEGVVGGSIVDTDSWRPREAGLFPENLRREASRMARLYEVFYCVEQTVRSLVRKGIQDERGGVREALVATEMLRELKARQEREAQSGIAAKRSDLLDFATLGELGQIIDSNWDAVFKEFLEHRDAAKRLLASLNALRSPVAHSIPLPFGEANRLGVFLADWFKLSG
jgi:hypothetical protein